MVLPASPGGELRDMNTVDLRQRSRVEQQIEHERIARRAYELFEARGRESGHAEEDWCLAEMDLRSCEGSPREPPSRSSATEDVCAPKKTASQSSLPGMTRNS